MDRTPFKQFISLLCISALSLKFFTSSFKAVRSYSKIQLSKATHFLRQVQVYYIYCITFTDIIIIIIIIIITIFL